MSTNYNTPTGSVAFSGPIGPNITTADYGILHSFYLIGGSTEVPAMIDRNQIPIVANGSQPYSGFNTGDGGWSTGRRKIGMTVHVIEEQKTYRLIPKGYFGNNGAGSMSDWQLLSDAEKAVLLDPTFEATTVGGNPSNGFTPTTISGSGIADDCWVEVNTVGLDGAQGFQGENGVSGPFSGTLGDPTGSLTGEYDGHLYFNDNGDVYVWDAVNSTWNLTNNLTGAQGATGADGPIGIKGDTGADGPIGIKGDQGEDGPIGPDGPIGIKGDIGADGPIGFQGEVGATGLKGDQGEEGPIGPDGPIGIKGDTGLTGFQGEVGATGLKGDTGAEGADGPLSGTLHDPNGAVTGSYNDQLYYCLDGHIWSWDSTTSNWIESHDLNGPQGLKGDKGDTGFTGATGPQGVFGAQGAIGQTGITGFQGEVGATGLKGDKGDTGAQGEVGQTGIKGDTGLKGDTGATGLKGDIGDQGQNGPLNGLDVDPNFGGIVGEYDEQLYYNSVGDIWAWDLANNIWTHVHDLTGDQGAKGEQGLKGDIGNTGLKGDIGAQGAVGATGLKGDIGAQGAVGATGLKGDKGDTGLKGDKGDTGAQGAKGEQGIIGITGFQGAKGEQGEQGSQGEQGIIGLTGFQGAKGEQGLKGDTGLKGDIGATGPKGDIGATGLKGDIGAQGFQGECGIQGALGAQGAQGYQGTIYKWYSNAGIPTDDALLYNEGDHYLNITGGDVYEFSGGTWILQGNLSGGIGAQGFQGEIGSIGIKGDKGDIGVKGDIGIKGDIGVQGTEGSQGEVGSIGPIGSQGAKGDKGLTGIQGEEGTQGEVGPIGPNGAQGAKGDKGDKGEIGVTGFQGEIGVTGFQGSTGLKGDIGYQGGNGTVGPGINFQGDVATQGNLPSSGNTQGDAYIVQSDDSFWMWNGTQWVDGGSIQGPQGPTGLKGDKGAIGVTGFQGIIGSTGPIGPDGLRGPQGIRGHQGIIGEKGLTGATGLKGDTGATGSQGLDGPVGNTGFQGATGAKGDRGLKGDIGVTGFQGDTGAKGDIGAQGAIGPKGSIGVTGFQGATGAKGDIGATGLKGDKGLKGDIGVTGFQGDTGAQGSIGAQGAIGPKGSIGVTGFQGVTGDKGATGAQGAKGEQGLKGDTGLTGPTGPRGLKGDKGDTGSQGVTGSTGNMGFQGATGLKGDTGSTGNMGFQGATGLKGDTGAQGAKGEQGLKGFQGDAGLLNVVTTCAGITLTGSTDVYAFIDTTSGPYTTISNRSLLFDALSSWHTQYSTDNPGYTGKLYIGGSNSGGLGGEQWLSHLGLLRNNTVVNRTNWLSNTPASLGSSVGWYQSGSSGSYTWTIEGVPTDWDNVNYVLPERVFFIEFCNEASFAYHNSSRDLTGEPTLDWNTDYGTFTTEYSAMDYFGGIFYPVSIEGNSVHSHGYASITGQNPIQRDGVGNFADVLGANYGAASKWTGVFGSLTVADNPYTSNNVDLNGYGWTGVYNKQEVAGVLDFDGPEFANDINSILDPSGGTSSSTINVIESYSAQTLTVRGFTSQTIDFALNSSGCIEMEVDALTGVQGDRGFQGSTGSKGLKGDQGSTGADAIGLRGPTGPQGDAGTNGFNGLPGQTGPQGAKGANGIGTTGAQGSQGSAGFNGIGSKGLKGDQGARGLTGIGLTGERGVQGTAGSNGYQGSTGSTGASVTGAQGAQGSNEADGTRCYKYISLNSIGRTSSVTSAKVSENFIHVPWSFRDQCHGDYYLWQVQSSYGSVNSSQNVSYKLMSETGGADSQIGVTWTHNANNKFAYATVNSNTNVHGAGTAIRVEMVSLEAPLAKGFAVTLVYRLIDAICDPCDLR